MAEITLIEALNDCLDRLNAGQTLQDCVQNFPQYEKELRALLATAEAVTVARPARAEFLAASARMRARVDDALTDFSIEIPRGGTSPFFVAATLTILLLGGILMIPRLTNIGMTNATPTISDIPTMMFTVTAEQTEQASPTLTETAIPEATIQPTKTVTVEIRVEVSPTNTPDPTVTSTFTVPATQTATAMQTLMLTETLTQVPATTGPFVQMSPAPISDEEECFPAPPDGWMIYHVRSGDTLSLLSSLARLPLSELMRVNCIERAAFIVIGQQIWLPEAFFTEIENPQQSGGGSQNNSGGGSDSGGDDSGNQGSGGSDDDNSGQGGDDDDDDDDDD